MLPFLDKKRISSVIIAQRGKDNVEVSPEVESGEGVDEGLKQAAEDVLRAINSNSVVDLAHALKAAYEMCASCEESPVQEDSDQGPFDV